jgi:hypothetical protein
MSSAHDAGVHCEADGQTADCLIWAARICFLEASLNLSDCAAQLWVAKKRGERVARAWTDTLAAYSSLTRSHTPRAERIKRMPWGDVPGESERFNDRWRALRELVVRFAADPTSVVDPTPAATHWGGMRLAADRERAERMIRAGKWKRARSVVGARLVNAFFSERRGAVITKPFPCDLCRRTVPETEEHPVVGVDAVRRICEGCHELSCRALEGIRAAAELRIDAQHKAWFDSMRARSRPALRSVR